MTVYMLLGSKIYHTSQLCSRLTKSGAIPLHVDLASVERAVPCTWCKRRDKRGVSGVLANAFTRLSRYRRGDITETSQAYEVRVKGQPTLVVTKLGRMELRYD